MFGRIHFDQATLAAVCRKNRIRRLRLSGSVLRDDFDPQCSDVDVLVEFFADADRRLSYFDLARIKAELETLFKRSVDLVLVDSLDPYFREEVLASAEDQYVAA